jgi:nicotinamide mononucleotide transporter
MTSIEWLASGFGLANIIFIVRRSVWNYPCALVMVSLYLYVFWDAKLYSDAGLQVFFFAVNLYGWWSWGTHVAEKGAIRVERLGHRGQAAWGVAAAIAIAAWGRFVAVNTDGSYPYWDAAVAILSIVGQILMTRRYVENWHWWIAVNLISVPLYLAKGLYPTAGLYGVFLAFSILGLVEWRRVQAKQS